MSSIEFSVPDAAIEQIVEAVTQRVLDRLSSSRQADPWPEWMAVDTAARYLDVSPERLRKLIARREIPFHQEGRGCRVLLKRVDLDQWMAGFRHSPRRRGDV